MLFPFFKPVAEQTGPAINHPLLASGLNSKAGGTLEQLGGRGWDSGLAQYQGRRQGKLLPCHAMACWRPDSGLGLDHFHRQPDVPGIARQCKRGG
ncbi:hypothetical protein D3C77_443640 [compost metagenome]